ncbi:MAG: hypothetical protein OdinLCB4_000215 [Candidatus Odinarchaeum yellowstonii]|jgi:hypothetical protein|uniref:Uncharacterized protein n=1 Tax=Odinarchaeota yellowstonii (strain LCB_4) TaxID=1841599 RepID=A0AAF0D2C2_ODILC|nr:MAG: hypothetical protein OdinLCB4_000215 [Candidatus Odinarchaeum yellowstonii]
MGFFKKYVYTIHSNDASPMLPLIDVAKTYGSPFICTPVPLRVDKIINGDLTTFILPDRNISIKMSGETYSLHILNLISEVIRLLSNWSKNIVKSRFNKELPSDRLISWLNKTLKAKLLAPTLSEDAGAFLNNYFETVLSSYFKGESIFEQVKSYLNNIINRCRSRIAHNTIIVSVKGEYVEYNILDETISEEEYLNPDIKGSTIPVDVYFDNRLKTMSFRPFLIYQDLLETAKYTLQTLREVELISPENLIDKRIITVNVEELNESVDYSNLSTLIDKIPSLIGEG